jgi:two-component system chemotaxis response regulator CheY
MRVLIVEDDFTSRQLMQILIARFGSYDVATNGYEAVSLLKSALDEGKRYDLICLDINMPEMDGQEALKRIREIENAHGIKGSERTKIIMTTAYSNYENVANAFEEQCDAYIVKPLEIDKFDQTLINLSLIKGSNN